MYDPKQHLFTQCAHRFPSREKCINPVPRYVQPSYCLLHYHQSLIKERTSYSHLQREALIPSSQKDKNEPSSSKPEESGFASLEPVKSFQDDALLPADIAEGLMPLLEKELRNEDFQSILDMVGFDQPEMEQNLPGEKFQEDIFDSKVDSNANNNRAGSSSQKSDDNQLQQLDNLPLPADIDTSMLSDLRTGSSPLPDNILSINLSPHFKLQKTDGSSETEELKHFEAKLQEQRLKGMQRKDKAAVVTESEPLMINGQGGHSSGTLNNGLSSQHKVLPSLHNNSRQN